MTGYYDPGMMLKVWFFAYCDRSWHSREVAGWMRYDVRYRYFVGSQRPDFRMLNRFRKDHLDLLAGYSVALVRHCEELGLIDSSVVALDGTKLRANASGRKRGKDWLREEIGHRLEHDVANDEVEAEAEVEDGGMGGDGESGENGSEWDGPGEAVDEDRRRDDSPLLQYASGSAFPAVIGLTTACFNRYLVNFLTLGVIRNIITFAGSWI